MNSSALLHFVAMTRKQKFSWKFLKFNTIPFQFVLNTFLVLVFLLLLSAACRSKAFHVINNICDPTGSDCRLLELKAWPCLNGTNVYRRKVGAAYVIGRGHVSSRASFLCSWLCFVTPSLSPVLRVAVQLRLSHGEIMRHPITWFGASPSARCVPKTRKWVQLAHCCQAGSLRETCLHDAFVHRD
jgi:hypothetical protein